MNRSSISPPQLFGSLPRGDDVCVLMFSGGRDSTLAAVRLSAQRYRPILVTVSSDHLAGIDTVKRRLTELRSHLGIDAPWVHVAQPQRFASAMRCRHRTCLPCHSAYAGIALHLALHTQTANVAFGYTGYQSDWLEQTPQAIRILRHHFRAQGVHLLLPVLDLSSKADAARQLTSVGLTAGALEQKCLIQQLNSALTGSALTDELVRWQRALRRTAQLAEHVELSVIELSPPSPQRYAPDGR